jgi:bacteriorhodopsin
MTSYAVLFAGIGILKIDCGEYIYPTRWLFYILSCGLLIYEIALIMKKDKFDTFKMIALNTIVMLTGYLASIAGDLHRWIFFMISCLAFILLLFLIHAKKPREQKIVSTIRWYVTFTWMLFPIVWALAPTGINIFGAFLAAIIYLLLDITTKIIFGLITAKAEAK